VAARILATYLQEQRREEGRKLIYLNKGVNHQDIHIICIYVNQKDRTRSQDDHKDNHYNNYT